jgi:hypothetical protein
MTVDSTIAFDRDNRNDEYVVEFQHEVGFPGRLKLYIHNVRLGITLVRVCKLKPEQITMPEDQLPFIQLSNEK